MVHVAREMGRQGFKIPLLIGGATTSRIHTAVKIAPAYQEPVVHVLDASRAVGVVGNLINPKLKVELAARNQQEQERAREQHLGQKAQRALLKIEEARTRKPRLDWNRTDVPRPAFTGVRALDRFPLQDIARMIDWTPFFHTWELRGRYPKIFDDPTVGSKARELFDDAQKLLDQIVSQKLLTARGVYGFFSANSVGDDIEIYADESRSKVLTAFHTLRQQTDKPEGQFNHALAD